MKKVDLNFEIENVEMLDLPPNFLPVGDAVHAGKILAGVLMNSIECEDPIKLFGWAVSLHSKMPLELSEADYNLLKNFVKESPKIILLAKAQILSKLNSPQ